MTNRSIFATATAAVLLAGCGGGGGSDSAAVDTTDPIQVAEAFYAAVDDGDLDSAVEYVLPEQAADFREAMSGGMPPMPADYEVVVMVQGDHAEASIVGASLEVDMSLVDGRWWMSN